MGKKTRYENFMNLKLKKLQFMYDLLNLQNMQDMAQQYDRTRSWVCTQLIQAEQVLQERLFERTSGRSFNRPHKMPLTPFGKLMRKKLKALIKQLQTFECIDDQ